MIDIKREGTLGENEKAVRCIHPADIPPGWGLREAIVKIPVSF